MDDPVNLSRSLVDFFEAIQKKKPLGTVINGDDDYDPDGDHDDNDEFKSMIYKSEHNHKYMSCYMYGNVFFDKNLKLVFTNNDTTDELQLHLNLNVPQLGIETLINEYFEPAKFGKGMETVYDPSVRVAHQYDARNGRFSFFQDGNNVKYPKFMSGIWNNIRKNLINTNFDLSIYKVNIYQEGGFFLKHKDTPIDATRSVGTLVIILPVKHEGGEFVISDIDGDHDETIGYRDNNDAVMWLAFFTDCDHEVKKITSGNRVSITYNIVSCDKIPMWVIDDTDGNDRKLFKKDNHYYSLTTVGKPMVSKKFNNIINQLDNTDKKKVGIFLHHKYTLGNIDTDVLKGVDAKIYKQLSEKYSCRLKCVIYRYDKYYPCDGCDDNEYEDKFIVYEITPHDWLNWKENGTVCDSIDGNDEGYEIIDVDSEKDLIKSDKLESCEYTGNESQDGYDCRLYFSVVLLIDM